MALSETNQSECPHIERVPVSPMNCIRDWQFLLFKHKSQEAVVTRYLFRCPLSVDERCKISFCRVCLVGKRFYLLPKDLLIQGSIQDGLCVLSEPVSK